MTTVNFPTTVDELRTALLEAGDDPATVAAMKKGELKERFIKLTTEEINFELESLNEASPVETLEGAIGVIYGSPEWQTFVLGQLNENEQWEGMPRVNGMNRLASLLLGDIIYSKASEIIVSNGEIQTVIINYEIRIEWKLNTPVGFGNMGYTPQIRVFGGVANCDQDGTIYGKHFSSTCETKAMGRALKKALGISVLSAEELMGGGTEELPKSKPTANITVPLQSVIKAKAEALKLDLNVVITEFNHGKYKQLSEFNMEEGRDLFAHINSYQQTKK